MEGCTRSGPLVGVGVPVGMGRLVGLELCKGLAKGLVEVTEDEHVRLGDGETSVQCTVMPIRLKYSAFWRSSECAAVVKESENGRRPERQGGEARGGGGIHSRPASSFSMFSGHSTLPRHLAWKLEMRFHRSSSGQAMISWRHLAAMSSSKTLMCQSGLSKTIHGQHHGHLAHADHV